MICTTNFSASGDVTIPNGMTFTVDSDLNGESPQFTLTCTSIGGPATTVTWARDSMAVSGGMTVLDDPVTAHYTHTLTVTGRLGGQYQCTVSNNKPSEASANFTVQGKREQNIRREQKKGNVYATFLIPGMHKHRKVVPRSIQQCTIEWNSNVLTTAARLCPYLAHT